MNEERRQSLLELSHAIGREDRTLAILGEGNTSTRLDAETFLVKASGTSLGTLKDDDVVACRVAALLEMLTAPQMTDEEIDAVLFASRVDAKSKKPSIEALFHAILLGLPDVEYVGHCHPVNVNRILCSPRAREFAERRIFPDEIVCCGVASVLVPYQDPGLPLARAIREGALAFADRWSRPPRVILLESHGIIGLGRTPEAVLSAILMAEKSATIWHGAAQLGGPKFLSAAEVERIAGRPDEKYRQKILSL